MEPNLEKEEVFPLQDVKMYLSFKVACPSAETHSDYQMLLENLNDPYKVNEIRFNIKQRPSWMKDEKFQDDVLYGTLRSNSGCFVKIVIKDADVKKEKKKKEVPVQQKLTERQIYE